jgi:SAM-dependent methyltransferase
MPLTFFDLVDISERELEIANPSSAEKMMLVGKSLRLQPGSRVIDFGCGFGEELAMWGEQYGIGGVGIDIRPNACGRATRKMASRGLADRIQIVCGSGSEYTYPAHTFDASVCLGATFIWQGFAGALTALQNAIRPGGRVAIGEPYWLSDNVPSSYMESQSDIRAENELLQMIRQEGFELENILRSSHDDWDRYECGNWAGLIRWLEENPVYPDRQQVIDHLHASQEVYLQYGRQYLGWAVYVLSPTQNP